MRDVRAAQSHPVHSLVEVATAAAMDALRQRLSVLSERYLAERLGIGLRTLRRSFLDERGVTAYAALRQLRLQEAQWRITTQPDLTLKPAAQQCGFGHYAGSAAIAAAPVMHAVLPEKSKHLRKSALLVVIAAIKRSGRSHLLNTIVSAYIDCASDFNLICIVEFLSRRNSRWNRAQCGGNKPFSFILLASGAV